MLNARYWIAAGKLAAQAVLALTLAGCHVPDFSQMSAPRFDVSALTPSDPTQFARKDRAVGPIGPNDLVDASGSCPGAAPPSPPPEQTSETAAPTAPTVAPPSAPHGVALMMTECEVVQAAGRPAEVQISTDHGERAVTMIYDVPERPIYHFVAGRLKTIERGAEPPPPEPVKKKKKPRTASRQRT